MLQVSDVAASSHWYQATLGLRSGHGGDDYEMLFDGDDFVLQLHRLDGDEHGLEAAADDAKGAGVSLWFETVDRQGFDALVDDARAAGAQITQEPFWNPVAHHHEATLVDPDGYVVIVNTPFEPTC
jgi:catechol 2,3-dioxygenase-like lactoylglutathione lyase family enzyme